MWVTAILNRSEETLSLFRTAKLVKFLQHKEDVREFIRIKIHKSCGISRITNPHPQAAKQKNPRRRLSIGDCIVGRRPHKGDCPFCERFYS